MEWALALLALALLGVAAVSRLLSGTPITPAIVFVAFGAARRPRAARGVDLSSSGLDGARRWRRPRSRSSCSADASRIDLGALRRSVGVPVRLLGIGLPLTIALGAPRPRCRLRRADPRRGRDPRRHPGADRRGARPGGRHRAARAAAHPPGPQRRERPQRRDLRAAAVRSRRARGRRVRDLRRPPPLDLLLEEIGYGVLGGVVAGLLLAVIVTQAGRRDLIAASWRQVIPAAGAALAYGIASALDGSGFIAAFVAGMVFRLALGRDPERAQPAHRGARAACSTGSRSCSSVPSCSGRRSAS